MNTHGCTGDFDSLIVCCTSKYFTARNTLLLGSEISSIIARVFEIKNTNFPRQDTILVQIMHVKPYQLDRQIFLIDYEPNWNVNEGKQHKAHSALSFCGWFIRTNFGLHTSLLSDKSNTGKCKNAHATQSRRIKHHYVELGKWIHNYKRRCFEQRRHNKISKLLIMNSAPKSPIRLHV